MSEKLSLDSSARGYLIHNLDAYTFHIAVFAIEAEGKETYFPETR